MVLALIISFVSFIVCLSIGLLVYYQSSKKLEHKLFFALCLVNSWMSLSIRMHYSAMASALNVLKNCTAMKTGTVMKNNFDRFMPGHKKESCSYEL